MKRILFSLFIFLGSTIVNGQPTTESVNDDLVKQLGPLTTLNVATIADTITEKFSDKKEKAKAIFYWIANNIALDPKATKSNDVKKINPEDVVQFRKTTPLGFANLVQEMCSHANIRCLVVDGYVKNYADEINNKADEINHSWNVVQLGQSPDKWYYIDAAKASGYLDKKMSLFTKQFTSEYFFADKKLFNMDHYPDNTAWLLEGEGKSLSQFYALPVIGYTAYAYSLQNPKPLTGHIKSKVNVAVSFSFNYNGAKSITDISLVMGDEKRQSKPEPMNFSDNGGWVKFTYTFKKADTYPVTIVVDGKPFLQYYLEVED